MRFQNYFVVDGQKYYTGTVFIVKDGLEETEATFICYDTKREVYVYKLGHARYHAYQEHFDNCFIKITSKTNSNVHFPEEKVLPDSMIDGLTIGWVWYIFLMIVATIFKGNIILWCLISYVFFSWRKKKIEKGGRYVEW